MKERPILFNGEMVRAILDGSKTQTRRPVAKQKYAHGTWATPEEVAFEFCRRSGEFLPPLGTVGDRLWVRETWRCRGGREYEYQKHQPSIMYHADAEPVEAICNEWRPSIHMPRWASRIDLEITRVWVELVQDITEEDAKADGVEYGIWHQKPGVFHEPTDEVDVKNGSYKAGFGFLWQSIYGTWDVNPFVWAYEFRRLKP